MLMPPQPDLPWWATTLCFGVLTGLIAICLSVISSFITKLLSPED